MSERTRFPGRVFGLCAFLILISSQVFAQQAGQLDGRDIYTALQKFELKGKVSVSNLELKRDRAEMSFTGDFYFAAPVNGRIIGAVFVGTGKFRAPAPIFQWEKQNMINFINADVAESDFKTAVLRFSDDTFDLIGKQADANAAPSVDAQKLASELEPRLLKETGVNVSTRLMISLINNESPGFFLAQFDKGKLGCFTYLVDQQARIPGSIFEINGGEKVMLFRYAPYAYTNDIWIATYSEDDFKRGRVSYSDLFDVVSPTNYKMEIDLRDPRDKIRNQMHIDFESSVNNLRAVSMVVNDSLSAFDNERIKHSMRIKSAKFAGQELQYVQEEWESGITLILPKPIQKDEKFSVDLLLEGDIIDNQRIFESGYYPMSNTAWYPRYGYLKRSTFDLIFRHRKNDKVASVGTLVREEEWPDDKNTRLSEYKMDSPISFATFAAGILERHTEQRKLESGEIAIDLYSPPSHVSKDKDYIVLNEAGSADNIKESFVLAELGNALGYFSNLFGNYPYKSFKAAIHPFNFGQGLPTLLLLAPADRANKTVFSFIAHETSHQWWGNVVAWRSYRDQWLSEGFAEYSGMMYTLRRNEFNPTDMRDLIKTSRYNQTLAPKGDISTGKGKISEIGPLILGSRLSTRNTMNAYQPLIYDKGALVLRMLQFMFLDLSKISEKNPGEIQEPFFLMMKDFIKIFENKSATTEDFQRVANMHFAKTPIAQQFGLKDLDWFFQQWVYEAKLPSYRMEYTLEPGENNTSILNWTVYQDNAPANWFMPLPVVCKFGKQEGRALVYANGPKTTNKIVLQSKPTSVELDPDMWILSEKTSTKKM